MQQVPVDVGEWHLEGRSGFLHDESGKEMARVDSIQSPGQGR